MCTRLEDLELWNTDRCELVTFNMLSFHDQPSWQMNQTVDINPVNERVTLFVKKLSYGVGGEWTTKQWFYQTSR